MSRSAEVAAHLRAAVTAGDYQEAGQLLTLYGTSLTDARWDELREALGLLEWARRMVLATRESSRAKSDALARNVPLRRLPRTAGTRNTFSIQG